MIASGHAPRRFNDHVEVVARFLLGAGYRKGYIGFGGSEFDLAHKCARASFLRRGRSNGRTDGRMERHTGLDWMARQPAFESMFFDGSFPEIWWIAEPGDDTFMPRIPKVGQ